MVALWSRNRIQAWNHGSDSDFEVLNWAAAEVLLHAVKAQQKRSIAASCSIRSISVVFCRSRQSKFLCVSDSSNQLYPSVITEVFLRCETTGIKWQTPHRYHRCRMTGVGCNPWKIRSVGQSFLVWNVSLLFFCEADKDVMLRERGGALTQQHESSLLQK